MNGEWCYFSKFFESDTCEHIIRSGLAIPARDARIGMDGAVNSERRRSKVRFLDADDAKFKGLINDIWELGQWANQTWFKFDLSRLSYVQLAEYDESYRGEFKRHTDVFWMNDDPAHHRKLSCVIQLCEPQTYQGGDLELFEVTAEPDREVIREQGTALFFPSFIPHQATPVTKGRRYSLAAWFEGPKWR